MDRDKVRYFLVQFATNWFIYWLLSFIYLFSGMFDSLFAFSALPSHLYVSVCLCVYFYCWKKLKNMHFHSKMAWPPGTTSYLVTIVTDHVYFVRLRWPSHQLRLVLFDLFWSHYLKHLNNSFRSWRYLILIYISSFPQQSSYLQNLSLFKKNHNYNQVLPSYT